MSCCRDSAIDWKTHSPDCKWAPKLSGPTLYGADYPVEHKAQQTAYDRAQSELHQHVGSLAMMVNKLTARLDAALRRIEALEADVARLTGPQRIDSIQHVPGVWQKMPGTTVDVEVRGNEVIMTRAKDKAQTVSISQISGDVDAFALNPSRSLPCGCPWPHCAGHNATEIAEIERKLDPKTYASPRDWPKLAPRVDPCPICDKEHGP